MVGGLVSFRTSEREVEPEHVRRVDPGVRHVVAVTDPGVTLLGDIAQLLPNGEQVGENLAWVHEVGEAVDHRYGGVLRELLDVLVRERTDHDAVDVPREDTRRISDRLTAAQLHVTW